MPNICYESIIHNDVANIISNPELLKDIEAYRTWLANSVRVNPNYHSILNQGKIINILEASSGNIFIYMHLIHLLHSEITVLDTLKQPIDSLILAVSRIQFAIRSFVGFLSPDNNPTHQFIALLLENLYEMTKNSTKKIDELKQAETSSTQEQSPLLSNSSVATIPHVCFSKDPVEPSKRRGFVEYQRLQANQGQIRFFSPANRSEVDSASQRRESDTLQLRTDYKSAVLFKNINIDQAKSGKVREIICFLQILYIPQSSFIATFIENINQSFESDKKNEPRL